MKHWRHGMSEKMELPQGWTYAVLQDLLDYIQPTNFIVESTEYDDSYKTPVLTAGKTFLLGKTNETTGIFTNLPVIIFDDFTTATKFVNFPFKVKSSAMKILKPTCKWVDIWYAYYFIQTIRITVDTHKRYWISNYSQLPILLPPLAEQHRIVAKIEELFSSLDKGIESLKTAQAQLKTYRQAVLKWAFEGKLTNPPAGRAGENVKDGELPEGWKWEKLKNLTEVVTDGDHQPPPKAQHGIPFITISNIEKSTNRIDFSNTFLVSRSYYDSLKIYRKPKTGDILYTVTGSFGIPLLIDYEKEFCFQRHIGLIRPKNIINQKFLYYALQTNHCFNQASSTATGTAQKTVALSSLRNFNIPVTSFPEQSRIVGEIEKRLSVCDKLEESITQSLSQAEALRQSILKKAFEGKLVPQDPSDEPASVLLERIRAERANSTPVKKTRTPKGKK